MMAGPGKMPGARSRSRARATTINSQLSTLNPHYQLSLSTIRESESALQNRKTGHGDVGSGAGDSGSTFQDVGSALGDIKAGFQNRKAGHGETGSGAGDIKAGLEEMKAGHGDIESARPIFKAGHRCIVAGQESNLSGAADGEVRPSTPGGRRCRAAPYFRGRAQ